MGRIAITKLVLRNFRSFLGEHTIELPRSGLVILLGESGAGKSAILHAIAYAFGFAPYSAKALQNWHTDEPMSVEVHMDTPEGKAVMTRGSTLSLQVDFNTFTGSAKWVEQKLDELCGINATLRAALTYRGQKKAGLFLSMTDAEKKEFFVDVLKLHWAEDAIGAATKAITGLEKDVAAAQAAVATAEQVHAVVAGQIPTLKPRNTADLEAEIATLKRASDELAAKLRSAVDEGKRVEQEEWSAAKRKQSDIEPQIRELEAEIRRVQTVPPNWDTGELMRLTSVLREAEERKKSVAAADSSRRFEQEDRARVVAADLGRARGRFKEAFRDQGDLNRVNEEVARVRAEECPTCARPWSNAIEMLEDLVAQQLDLAQRVAMLNDGTLGEDVKRLEKQLADLSYFEEDGRVIQFDKLIESIRGDIEEEKKKIAVKKAVYQSETQGAVAKLQLAISKLRAAAATEATAMMQDKDRPSAVLGRTVRDLGHEVNALWKRSYEKQSELDRIIREDGEAFMRHQAAVQAEYITKGNLNDRRFELDEVQRKLNTERDFQGMLKGFLSAIFDEILSEITDETNTTLGTLPNVAHMTIRFVSDYQTQKGTTKQAIVPIASFNGDDRPLDSGCSGGMETSVELAVDLAVAHVVARRTGSDLGWLILDESFNGHDQATKESCLEVLSKYANDKLVLIVDHGAEAKEMFTQRIHVINHHGRSELARETA
jgi:DNA repair exonuclease SbcCD ATPase subunit